jgi:predicted anti-sigma-YlaC factor YlaD
MVCFYWRWRRHQATAARRPLPPGVEQHLEQCAACRAEATAEAELARRLRGEATRTFTAAPGLADRVAAGVARATDNRRPAPRITPAAAARWRPRLALAATILLLAGLGWYTLTPAPPTPEAQAAAELSALAARLLAAEAPPAGTGATPLAETTAPFAAPLAGEAERLRADAAAAGRFLLSCLPVDVDATAPAEGRP